MNKKLKIPKFKNKIDEQDFWNKVDLSENFEKSDFVVVSFPDLKPTSQPISLRIPNSLLARIKEDANALDIPYQSLMKQYLAKGTEQK